jgi:type IV pilus assembly protein PilX
MLVVTMQYAYSDNRFPNRQRGAVLFVALVFLILLTLLGLTASSTSILQERMTGGLHNGQLAMMGAETALRGVEWDVWSKTTQTPARLHCGGQGLDDPCYQASNVNQASGVAVIDPGVTQFRHDPASSGPLGRAYATKTLTGMSGAQASASLSAQPLYIIEELGRVLPPGASNSAMGGSRDPFGGGGPNSHVLHSYRNSARSAGGDQGSVRGAESYFVAQPPSF